MDHQGAQGLIIGSNNLFHTCPVILKLLLHSSFFFSQVPLGTVPWFTVPWLQHSPLSSQTFVFSCRDTLGSKPKIDIFVYAYHLNSAQLAICLEISKLNKLVKREPVLDTIGHRSVRWPVQSPVDLLEQQLDLKNMIWALSYGSREYLFAYARPNQDLFVVQPDNLHTQKHTKKIQGDPSSFCLPITSPSNFGMICSSFSSF
jgi:hypothetical protein